MSLEYLLLTFIALSGSLWINSARERSSPRFPVNGGDDVHARRASCSDGTPGLYRADTPSVP